MRPFRLGQWVRLAFVGLLAGEMGSGGGCNFSYPGNTQQRGSQQFVDALPAQLANHMALFAGLIAALIVVGFGLVVLFTYINSVMRFVLFDSIVARECHVRQGWARRKRPGFRLFQWQLLLMLGTLAAVLIVIGVPAACAWALGWFTHPRAHLVGLVVGGIVVFLIFLAVVIFMAIVHVMTKDFVVPQMALEDVSAMEGWRKLCLWLKFDKGGYAAYIAVKIALALGAMIAFLIVTLIALLVLLIPIGGLGFVIVLAGKAAGWTWNPYTITLAVILGCVALAIFMFAAALLAVPVIVFFPAYSIYFFAPRYSQLASLLWPQPPVPAASGGP
jgi:hypothetical protein